MAHLDQANNAIVVVGDKVVVFAIYLYLARAGQVAAVMMLPPSTVNLLPLVH